jgi:hypothetical protein
MDQIVQKAGPTLAETYQNLTGGRTYSFWAFKSLLTEHFPPLTHPVRKARNGVGVPAEELNPALWVNPSEDNTLKETAADPLFPYSCVLTCRSPTDYPPPIYPPTIGFDNRNSTAISAAKKHGYD